MTNQEDDDKANSGRRIMMISDIDLIKTRMIAEKNAMNGSKGKARNKDLAKRSKRELQADIDDILKCMSKFEGEASQCRTDAKVLLKELERRP